MRLLLLLTFFCLVSGPTAVAETTASSWVSKRKKKRKKRRKRKRRQSKKRTKKKAKVKAKPSPSPTAPPKTPTPVPVTPSPESVTPQDDRPNVAVLSFHAVHGVEQSVADLLSEILLTQVGNAPYFSQVIGGSDMQELLNLEQQKSALGCDDDSCLSSLGGALGVALMIAPSIGKLGDQYILNLKITDVDAAIVRARLNVEIDGERQLKSKLEAAIRTLLKRAFIPGEIDDDHPDKDAKKSESLPLEQSPKVEPPTATSSLTSLGFTLMAIGAASSVSAYYLQYRNHSDFDASTKTLADYDKGLENTYYANIGLGVGITSLVSGGITWWLAP